MGKNNFTSEYELIFLCAKLDAPAPARNEINKLLNAPLNWDKIKEISIHQEILPFFYYNLKKMNFQNLVPKEMLAIMEKHLD
jgi:hypothetical protein